MSAAFESARRAASYLGSAAAIAIAPSFPISFSPRSRSVRGPPLKSLDLHSNHIGDEGAIAIARALPR